MFSGVTFLWLLDHNIVRVNIRTWRMFLFVVPISAYLASGARRGGKHALQFAQMTTGSQWIVVL